jgi:hypothetical protein
MVHTRATFLYVLGYNLEKARDEATKNQVKQTFPRNVPCLCTIAKCGYLYQAFGIQVNDGMYIAQRKELKSGNNIFIKKSQVSLFLVYICFCESVKRSTKSCF